MLTPKIIIVIVVVAAIFGVLLSTISGASIGWQRPAIAACAFVVLALLLRYVNAKRKE